MDDFALGAKLRQAKTPDSPTASAADPRRRHQPDGRLEPHSLHLTLKELFGQVGLVDSLDTLGCVQLTRAVLRDYLPDVYAPKPARSSSRSSVFPARQPAKLCGLVLMLTDHEIGLIQFFSAWPARAVDLARQDF